MWEKSKNKKAQRDTPLSQIPSLFRSSTGGLKSGLARFFDFAIYSLNMYFKDRVAFNAKPVLIKSTPQLEITGKQTYASENYRRQTVAYPHVVLPIAPKKKWLRES